MSTTTISTAFTFKNGAQSKNRFFKSAMSEQLADENHNPDEGLCKLYKLWANGGAGIVVTGNIMIDREHLGEPKNIVLDKESELRKFRDWVTAGSENDTQLWAQLNHPGKQTPKFIQASPLAPSAIPLDGALQTNFNVPRALSEDDILHIVSKFWESAALAKSAGFHGVQIHAAHGYLISQFLSPRHNRRKDNWGGSLENRMRFLMEVYRGIRNAVGNDFPIAVKLNSADFMKGGFSERDSLEVARALAEAGVDLIEISGGSYEAPAMAEGVKRKASTQKREAYFLEFAKALRESVSIPIVVTGGFRSVDAMNQALSSNATDFIGIARPLAVDPALPNKAMANPGFNVELRPLSTGVKKIDDMILLNMSWYEAQFDRIAKGKAPKPELNEWYAAWKVFLNLGVYAFRKRRA